MSNYRVAGVTGAWRRLDGRVAPQILRAPKTAGDPESGGQWPEIHERTVTYLQRQVVGAAWADHLTLAAVVMAARRIDVHTITMKLRVLNSVFRDLLPSLGVTDLATWDPDAHLPAYLRGDTLPRHNQYRRAIFRSEYSAVTRHLRAWHASLPAAEQALYAPFVLRSVHPWSIEGLALQKEVRREGQASRKAEVAALLPSFMELRAQAHFRFNRLQRLREAYRTAVASAEQGKDRLSLPLAFSYEEGGDPGQGVRHRERLHFRLWDRRSFVLAHREQYSKHVLIDVQLGRRAFEDACNGWYLEFVRSEALHGDGPTEGFWFLDLLRLGLLGRTAMDGSPDEVAAKQAWLRSWGYGEKDGALVVPFHGLHAGLLTLSNTVPRGDGQFITIAQQRAEGVLIAVEPLYAAALFGLLAVEIFSTTGMRINEAMQIRIARDCWWMHVYCCAMAHIDENPVAQLP